jgi:hypothetical protein
MAQTKMMGFVSGKTFPIQRNDVQQYLYIKLFLKINPIIPSFSTLEH